MRRPTRKTVFLVSIIACLCLAAGLYVLLIDVNQDNRDSANRPAVSDSNKQGETLARKELTGSKVAAHATSSIGTEFMEFRRFAGDQIARESMKEALFELERRDPRDFVRRSSKDISPSVTNKLLTPDALPTLYALLKDPAYRDHWPEVAETICYLGDDAKSASAVIEYLRRSDWKRDANEARREWRKKVTTLSRLGLIGGEKAEGVLLKAMTPDGAEELAEAWFEGGTLPTWAEKPEAIVTEVIQGEAALGLIHAQSKEGIRKVGSLYESALKDSHQRAYATTLFQETAEAMAVRDLIQSMGMEAYLDRLGSPVFHETIFQRTTEYTRVSK